MFAASASARRKISFVTSNKNKVIEVNAILADSGLDVISHPIDLPELQGEPEDIAKQKCLMAYEKIKGPTLVDDTSLCYDALKGLPGPYIKWFLEKIGLEGLYNLLAAYTDKTAYGQSIFAYVDENMNGKPEVFVGRCKGTIVFPRGNNGNGWDAVFQPDGYTETYSEMNATTKNKISPRYKSLQLLKQYFLSEKPVEATESTHNDSAE